MSQGMVPARSSPARKAGKQAVLKQSSFTLMIYQGQYCSDTVHDFQGEVAARCIPARCPQASALPAAHPSPLLPQMPATAETLSASGVPRHPMPAPTPVERPTCDQTMERGQEHGGHREMARR